MLLLTLCLCAWSKVGDPESRPPPPPAHEVVSEPAPLLAPLTVDTREVTMLQKVLDGQDAALMALDKLNDAVVHLSQVQAQAWPPAPAAEDLPKRQGVATPCPCPPGTVCPAPADVPPPPRAAPPAVSVLPRYLPTAGDALNRGYFVAFDANNKGWYGRSQREVDRYVATVPRRVQPMRAQSYSAPAYQPAPTYAAPSYAAPMYSSPMTSGSSSCGPGGCGTSGLFGGMFR